jgi:hypothetical protein
LKSSHDDPKVNDKFDDWLHMKYGKHRKVVAHRGKIHDYLSMELHYRSEPGKVKIGMIDYVENMLRDFPEQLKDTDISKTPAGDDLFNHGQGKKLEKERAEQYYTMVAKGLFLCKRARPDIQLTIAVLCTRVKDLNRAGWKKLVRLMKYLNGTKKLRLTLGAGNLNCIKWSVDASFAVHPDFKSHTGAVMSFDGGTGAVISVSRKKEAEYKKQHRS